MESVRKARQQLQGFLLRQDLHYPTRDSVHRWMKSGTQVMHQLLDPSF
jgi:hypothetical protein